MPIAKFDYPRPAQGIQFRQIVVYFPAMWPIHCKFNVKMVAFSTFGWLTHFSFPLTIPSSNIP